MAGRSPSPREFSDNYHNKQCNNIFADWVYFRQSILCTSFPTAYPSALIVAIEGNGRRILLSNKLYKHLLYEFASHNKFKSDDSSETTILHLERPAPLSSGHLRYVFLSSFDSEWNQIVMRYCNCTCPGTLLDRSNWREWRQVNYPSRNLKGECWEYLNFTRTIEIWIK